MLNSQAQNKRSDTISDSYNILNFIIKHDKFLLYDFNSIYVFKVLPSPDHVPVKLYLNFTHGLYYII
jgi:hypothetical protein